MFGENNGLPIGGSVLLAFVLYAFVSGFLTGPLVAERMAEKSGWPQMCTAHIRETETRKQPPAATIPQIGCNDVMGMFGQGGRAWCQAYGRDMQLPFAGVLNQIEAQKEQARLALIDQATAQAGTRCACAVLQTIEAQRIAFALHAGSLRLITPAPVKSLSSELKASLNTPHCAMRG